MDRLTEEEIATISMLAEGVNLFSKLPVGHPKDFQEFVAHIHAAQNIVMSRLAVRVHADFFV